jgi:hypothetical protein
MPRRLGALKQVQEIDMVAFGIFAAVPKNRDTLRSASAHDFSHTIKKAWAA